MSPITKSGKGYEIPLIDLSPGVNWRRGRVELSEELSSTPHSPPVEVMTLSVSLCEALREVGVVYISHHGVPRALRRALEESARVFFARPVEEKNLIAMREAGHAWRGYFAEGAELTSGRPDYKEGLYFGEEHSSGDPLVQRGAPMHGANQWPAHPPRLRRDVLALSLIHI